MYTKSFDSTIYVIDEYVYVIEFLDERHLLLSNNGYDDVYNKTTIHKRSILL